MAQSKTMTQEECVKHLEIVLSGKFENLQKEVSELSRLIKVGNGHASLCEQAKDNTDFRLWAEPFLRSFPWTLFKWWIATMLTLGGMLFGILKLMM